MENILFQDDKSPRPSTLNRSFYPANTDIINHIYKAVNEQKLSKLDQVNLQKMINEWTSKKPTSKFYLRMSTVNEEGESAEPAQKLLYVHQEQWQRRLMVKYGNEISLLDATYRATNYALPSFLVCVKSNNGYAVVGMYISRSCMHSCQKDT